MSVAASYALPSTYILMGGGEADRHADPLPRHLDSADGFGTAPHDSDMGSRNGRSINGALGPTTNPIHGSPVGPGATVSVMGTGVPIVDTKFLHVSRLSVAKEKRFGLGKNGGFGRVVVHRRWEILLTGGRWS